MLKRVLCVAMFALLAACSADEPASGGRGSSANDGDDGEDVFGNPTMSPPTGNPGAAAIGGSGGDGSAGGSLGASRACGGDAYGAEPRQLDIYVILDESMSMILPIDLWGPVTAALNTFFTSPEADGIGVGINYFAGNCDVNLYATPETAIAPLPDNAPLLQASMAARQAFFGTATTHALLGATMHQQMRQTQMPETKQIILLVTDGAPFGCDDTVPETLQSAVQAAADAFGGTPSIPVYVLGLGDVNGLDQIAVAGGTNTSFVADPQSNQAVVDAMNAIRGQALPCDYAIPQTTGRLDPMQVNLEHELGGNLEIVDYVGNVAACDAAAGGWYYDDADAPGRIFACDATCSAFAAGGAVNVVVGCPTQVPQ